jgi:hypothetical protein
MEMSPLCSEYCFIMAFSMQFSPGRPSPLIRCLHQQNMHIFKNENLFSITPCPLFKITSLLKARGSGTATSKKNNRDSARIVYIHEILYTPILK